MRTGQVASAWWCLLYSQAWHTRPVAAIFARSQRVLWRILPGVVITQRIDGDPGHGVAELCGTAAEVWVLLDQPSDLANLERAFCSDATQTSNALIQRGLMDLVRCGLVTQSPVG